MEQSELELLVKEWQEVLKLQAWDIKVIFCRSSEMNSLEAEGECYVKDQMMRAIIHVLDPIDYKDDFWDQDFEETIVHELLHLCFSKIPYEENSKDLEPAIELLSKSLVKLKRAAIKC
jgi:hypothetical protein